MLKALKPDYIKINSNAKNKSELFKEISALIAKSSLFENIITQKELETALIKREQESSTAFSDGVAIPHCRFNNLEGFVVGLIVLEKGIECDSQDGKKTDLIFFSVGPTEKRNEHIKILSTIATLSKKANVLENIRKSKNSLEVYNILQKNIVPISDDNQKCQFTVFIQNEKYFEDVLELLSSEVEGSIVVMETINAGYYLHKVPLFASFWTDSGTTFNKTIVAIIDKKYLKDTINQINLLCENSLSKTSDLMVTVQDLIFCEGSIAF